MTRLSTCSGGTKLALCGNRVQLCGGGFAASCASVVNSYECTDPLPEAPTPPALVDTTTEPVQVYAWSYERVWTYNRTDGQSDVFADYLVRGVFGTAWQWNRPATDLEVRTTYGFGDSWSGAFSTFPYAVPGGTLYAHAFQYQTIERNEAGNPSVVGWARAAQFPAATGVPYFGWIVHLLNGNSGIGSGAIVCQDLRPQFGTTVLARVTVSGDPDVPGAPISESTRRESFDSVFGEVVREDRRTLRLEPVAQFVRHLDSWEGPAGFNVCDVLGASGLQDGNSNAIASAQASDPLNRPGCCG